jgi:hypothetical protein
MRKAKKAAASRSPKTSSHVKRATETKANKRLAPIDHAAVAARRAKAYGEMENSVCDLARAADVAMKLFDDDALFLFAVGQLDFMVQRFRARYYAEEFPGDN